MDSLRTILTRLEKQGAALGHFNVADLVLVKSVLAAAAEIGVPVMVGRPRESELSLEHTSSQLW